MDSNINKMEFTLTLNDVTVSDSGIPEVKEAKISFKTEVTDSSLQNYQNKMLALFGGPLKEFLEGLFQATLEDMNPKPKGSRPSNN